MKIIHVTPYYKPAWVYGGPIQSISKLAEEQGQIENTSIVVLTTTANGASELNGMDLCDEIEGVRVNYYRRWFVKSIFFSPGLYWNLYKALTPGTIVHIHTWWNLCAILAVGICRYKGIRPIFSPRGMLSPYSFLNRKSFGKRAFHSLIGKKLLMGTSLHATSEQEKEECLSLIPRWKNFVLPNLLELPSLSSRERRNHGSAELQILFLSRIHPKKGLALLFDALTRVKFSWNLVIAGDGDAEYINALRVLSEKEELKGRIKWVGWVDRETAFQLMMNSDLFVLPSQNENFANVVIESLAVGTPVLITDKVGLHEYVSRTDLGWVVPQNVEQWAQSLTEIASNKVKRTWITENSPSIIERDFAASKLALKYLEAYQSFAG